jgi:hypothetical protein
MGARGRATDPEKLRSIGEEIVARLRSTGGRPAMRGASVKPKVSLRPTEWNTLKELAAQISDSSGRSVTPSQLAGQLLSSCLRDLAKK